MIEDMLIFQKTYDLLLWSQPMLMKFPKGQQFILRQQIQNGLIDFLKLLVEANAKRDKKSTLFLASVELDKNRFLIRLAKDLKFISLKQYTAIMEKINEIGKMLGGWIKKF